MYNCKVYYLVVNYFLIKFFNSDATACFTRDYYVLSAVIFYKFVVVSVVRGRKSVKSADKKSKLLPQHRHIIIRRRNKAKQLHTSCRDRANP